MINLKSIESDRFYINFLDERFFIKKCLGYLISMEFFIHCHVLNVIELCFEIGHLLMIDFNKLSPV